MPDSTIWISSSEGVKEYDPATKKVTDVDVNATLNLIEIGPTGTVWGLDINGLLDSTSTLRGNLLGRMDLNANRFKPVTITPQYRDIFAQGMVLWFIEARDGTLWFGRNDGLMRYVPSTETFTLFDKSKGLAYYNVYTILEDAAGFLWMTTEHNISRFDPKTERFRHFEKEDGLRPFRMNRGSVFLRKNGEMLFGGVGGVNIFHPASIRDLSTPPRILITDVNVAGKPRPKNGDIAIDWADNEISIEYVSINFRNTNRTTYAYKLEGYHKDWVDAGTRRLIQFTNLPPGPYTLMVKATNAEGLVSEVPAQLSIRILPPWWRTWWAYGFYALMFAGVAFGIDRTQRRRLIRKERERTREHELAQAKEIEKAYTELKSTQAQLVQQEKLASLGQLTAGIAHEIKNPLNFVNNFASVSVELVEELKQDVDGFQLSVFSEDSPQKTDNRKLKTRIDETINDLKTNLGKIHEHGSRADKIVKSMLMHSRGGSGKMEPTDVNALLQEYANLAFHGMRAGKNPISVDIRYELDPNAGSIPMVAEDFSRVILNLCNNAFDALRDSAMRDVRGKEPALSEAKGAMSDSPNSTFNIQPSTLILRSKRTPDSLLIEVEDNGPGIPDEIKSRILEPFFTTKKGTEGTGLGLSISMDIITAHRGELRIEDAHPGARFVIRLQS
jgi:signal transduction histidine kinase/streptogramin lyase